jgi:deoxyribodipyrimidine photo-lyase
VFCEELKFVAGPSAGITPSRAQALERLAAFVPYAGRTYSAKRNYDLGAGQHRYVSGLSPDIRHRLVTEEEVVAAVLQAHSAAAAEKFIQEVCWRTYWKGWLEQRPQMWADYVDAVDTARTAMRDDDSVAAELAAAERGDTGLACFDAWARELVATGYLHNHARMWFASIWIFTLKLPWVLGADFFFRHLLDGDPASNTLSWRWVAGLHTPGKTYLARAENIAIYTEGRFSPAHSELAPRAAALTETLTYERRSIRPSAVVPPGTRMVLLVTEDDLTPESWAVPARDVCAVALFRPQDIGPQPSRLVRAFKIGAMADANARARAHWQVPVEVTSRVDELVALARAHRAVSIVTAQVPVGYTRSELDWWAEQLSAERLPLLQISRPWDALFWPYAKTGFFQLKDRIPAVLTKLGLQPSDTKP